VSDDEAAAIAAALTLLADQSIAPPNAEIRPSRWKLAARHPELELEAIRALR
jgi:hypothetical protein